MSADETEKVRIGARLRAERKARRMTVSDLAERFREIAPPRAAQRLPKLRDLERTIRGHEAGEHSVGPRYRALYAAAYETTEDELFAPPAEPEPSLWLPFEVGLTPDDSDRLVSTAARPSRLDAGTLDALTTVLAGQRRLEDAIGPAALRGPVTAQLDGILAMLRDVSGPLRDRLGSVAAEWSAYAGWLHATLRHDAPALKLFDLAEELADDAHDGVIAAIATSFRGYVARQQRRYELVVRASRAAMASPGRHPIQPTYDLLQAAQGYAGLGDVEQARRLLDEAAERARDTIEPPPAVYWYSEPFFQLNIGMVHHGLGLHTDAVALLEDGLRGMPEDQADAEWLHEYRVALEEARAPE
ncbi:hypothetical protein GCM10009678_40230 [Actinomadura kijaniata]|uniref:Transcriptional regulator with XRE-family HTH domain n=1 Tax=Actinomadura namibiensis TaxID=182080 RepID=A0A7W3LUB5_ACTNM|nr:transcriptional regulator [Actinomadura namibiensis]MBA8954481.1 transcriptional regulator with XRE-family HTH domain [Actinomadura namibiensis]